MNGSIVSFTALSVHCIVATFQARKYQLTRHIAPYCEYDVDYRYNITKSLILKCRFFTRMIILMEV